MIPNKKAVLKPMKVAICSLLFAGFASATPPKVAPVTLSVISSSEIDVQFQSVGSAAVSYYIYDYEDGVDTTMRYVGAISYSGSPTNETYQVKNLHGNTTYFFMVVSVAADGSKTNSDKQSAATLPDTTILDSPPPQGDPARTIHLEWSAQYPYDPTNPVNPPSMAGSGFRFWIYLQKPGESIAFLDSLYPSSFDDIVSVNNNVCTRVFHYDYVVPASAITCQTYQFQIKGHDYKSTTAPLVINEPVP